MAAASLPHCDPPLTSCPFCPGAPSLSVCGDVVRALGMTYTSGLQEVIFRRRRCPSCCKTFSGCWAFAPDGGPALIACHPHLLPWFVFRERLRTGILVALHIQYLDFMTASLLFLRGSFSGLAKVVAAMFPARPLGDNDARRGLEHEWFLHSALVFAWQPSLVGTPFDIRTAHADKTLEAFEADLHCVLRASAAAHHCERCQNPVLAGDGCMKLTTSICNERTSAVVVHEGLGLAVYTGCSQRPKRGSVFCHQHWRPATYAPVPEIREHKFIRGTLHFRYVGTTDFVSVLDVDLRRLLQYDSALRLTDYSALATSRFDELLHAPRLHDAHRQQHVLQMDASDFEAIQTCNCLKDERKRLAVRRYAGVFVTVMPCGHIVSVRHMVGAESLPQVALSFAHALQAVPTKSFLCYDNACALARYCRNPVRSDATAATRTLRDCTFVLPESHARGHTACLDESHSHYLPEVRKASHPILAGVNTEVQEHVFAWSRWLVYVANPMKPVRHRVFFVLMCLLRNAHRARGAIPSRRPRQRRQWGLWGGAARRQALPSDLPQAMDAPPPPPQAPVGQPPAAAAAFKPYLMNQRDRKVHRLSGPASLACGASLPARFTCFDFLDAAGHVGRRKLCLRNGCFSAGADFLGR